MFCLPEWENAILQQNRIHAGLDTQKVRSQLCDFFIQIVDGYDKMTIGSDIVCINTRLHVYRENFVQWLTVIRAMKISTNFTEREKFHMRRKGSNKTPGSDDLNPKCSKDYL